MHWYFSKKEKCSLTFLEVACLKCPGKNQKKKKNQMTYFQENFIKENQHKNQNQNLHYQHQNLSREFYQKTFYQEVKLKKKESKN